jgi:hypothetical protein
MKTKLTPSFIDTLNLKSEKQYYGDTEVPGLVLVIPGIPKKKKISDISYSFYFNYRSSKIPKNTIPFFKIWYLKLYL